MISSIGIISFILCLTLAMFNAQMDDLSRPENVGAFPVAFFKNVANTTNFDQNIALSPFSADAALSMTYVGAREGTRSEIGQVLGIATDAGTATQDFAKKFRSINTASENYVLNSANGMFVEKSYDILADFVSAIQMNFAADVQPVSFQTEPETARQQVNTFASSKTNNKITELFPAGSVGPDTKLVLVNAVYFKADWEKPFDATKTSRQPFFTPTNQQPEVDLMHTEGEFFYTDSEELNAQMIEIPYKKGEMTMVVILPRAGSTITNLEGALNPTSLSGGLRQLFRQKVNLFLPKFRLERNYDLTFNLMSMGIRAALGDNADLSGISSRRDLRVSRVVQKVFVEVDEKGTEAAAATGVQIMLLSAPIKPDVPPVFRADRPFLFLIRHTPTDSIMFMGKVVNPTFN
ncbi:serpin B6-like [Paramacrobiotus metropolitanus]|uniref:serpin B6-like n=1 Tax=Paramacrobiotus metropolitanus TaxID=2943436 RepID=UPI002445CDA9|nr:serpin B6-like [Paramacrobiotus metropolitanus]